MSQLWNPEKDNLHKPTVDRVKRLSIVRIRLNFI